MRLKLALAVLLLAPSPALADMTAHYSFRSGPPGTPVDPAIPAKTLTIEIDSSGDARMEVKGKFLVIRRGGVDYIVLQDAAGTISVARVAEVLTLMLARETDKDAPPMEIEAKGEATVGGRKGTVWSYAPHGETPLELTMSADPALAPLGDFFRSEIGAVGDLVGPQLDKGNNLAELLHTLFAKGTPLRVEPLIELESVDTAEIDPHRFELPGPVISAEAFMAAVAPAPAAPPAPPGH